MKKVLVLLSLVLFFGVSFAQTSLSVAEDFTLTDVDGVEHVLFDYLDDGKYVLIDFFYTTCVPCQQTTPKIEGAYQYFGCNSADLIILGIDNGDTDAQVIAFGETYGGTYPAVSGTEGGGNAVISTYGIGYIPTVILIAPNRDIVEQDIWPIDNAASIITVVEPYGPEEASCGGLNNQTEMTVFALTAETGTATIGEGTIAIEVASGTDLSTLVPTFTLSDGAVATIDDVEQTSGVSVVDFSSGAVTYVITAENETDTESWEVTVTEAPSSINETNNQINVYPIPANNFVNITNARDYNLTIYNITGKIVSQKTITNNTETIDLQAYSAGLYTFKLAKDADSQSFIVNIVK